MQIFQIYFFQRIKNVIFYIFTFGLTVMSNRDDFNQIFRKSGTFSPESLYLKQHNWRSIGPVNKSQRKNKDKYMTKHCTKFQISIFIHCWALGIWSWQSKKKHKNPRKWGIITKTNCSCRLTDHFLVLPDAYWALGWLKILFLLQKMQKNKHHFWTHFWPKCTAVSHLNAYQYHMVRATEVTRV